jgi:hypothetical protein
MADVNDFVAAKNKNLRPDQPKVTPEEVIAALKANNHKIVD